MFFVQQEPRSSFHRSKIILRDKNWRVCCYFTSECKFTFHCSGRWWWWFWSTGNCSKKYVLGFWSQSNYLIHPHLWTDLSFCCCYFNQLKVLKMITGFNVNLLNDYLAWIWKCLPDNIFIHLNIIEFTWSMCAVNVIYSLHQWYE